MQLESLMTVITIQETLLQCDKGQVVLAHDAEQRPLLGVSARKGGVGELSFVQIDRVTMLELQRGMVDLHTVMTQRCAGIAVPA
jgi:hypothetical protein